MRNVCTRRSSRLLGVYGNGLNSLMPSLKRKIMREYTRVTYNNAEISERDTEFLECWENPAHVQTVCTRPSLAEA